MLDKLIGITNTITRAGGTLRRFITRHVVAAAIIALAAGVGTGALIYLAAQAGILGGDGNTIQPPITTFNKQQYEDLQSLQERLTGERAEADNDSVPDIFQNP